MFDTFDKYELKTLREIQVLVKQDPGYYHVLDDVIREIEKPVIYSVLVKFKDGQTENHKGFTKVYVRDDYIYLKRDCITLCYNMNELCFYQVIEIKQEV